jgi:hypothetical protein
LSLYRAPRRILLASGCHTPNRIPDVIGNQQGTGLVDGQPDRPSAAERHENDLVAVEAWPVPTAMFADEGAAAALLGKTVRRVERKPQSSDVRAQRIVGNNRLLDQIRTLPFLPPRFIAPERRYRICPCQPLTVVDIKARTLMGATLLRSGDRTSFGSALRSACVRSRMQ